LLAGAVVPLLLAMLGTPTASPSRGAGSARLPRKRLDRVAGQAQSPARRYREGDDFAPNVERAMAHLDDPRTMYYVSQALRGMPRVGTARHRRRHRPVGHPRPRTSTRKQWKRSWALGGARRPVRGFDGLTIDSRDILELHQEAARHGEPHARARMLAFRDIAAPKLDGDGGDSRTSRDRRSAGDPRRGRLPDAGRGSLG
jgi:hypothetical protein